MILVPYKVRGYHQTPIPFEVWGTMGVIDSCKVPAVDSNYEDTSP